MKSTRMRLAIVASALVILSTVGVGPVQAAPATSTEAPSVVAPVTAIGATPTSDPGAPQLGERLRNRLGDRGFGRFGRHLVHATVTVVGRDGGLVTLQFDHGTISAVDDAAITIAETGGANVTVATNDDTRVRKARKPATIADLAVGDEVFVVSVVEDGAATARGIVVPVRATD